MFLFSVQHALNLGSNSNLYKTGIAKPRPISNANLTLIACYSTIVL